MTPRFSRHHEKHSSHDKYFIWNYPDEPWFLHSILPSVVIRIVSTYFSAMCYSSTCTPHSVLTQKTVRPYGYSNTAHTTSANKFWRTFPQFLSKISSYICEVHHHFASEIEQVLVTNWSLSRSTWTTYTIVT